MGDALHILMIDDDTDDHYITKEVLKELSVDVRIDFISESENVFSHLENSTDIPNLILLDKHLPAVSGSEILKQLKSHSTYKRIPVVIISGSSSEAEINEFYTNGAAAFITKPSSGRLTTEKIAGFIRYWSQICELPTFP